MQRLTGGMLAAGSADLVLRLISGLHRRRACRHVDLAPRRRPPTAPVDGLLAAGRAIEAVLVDNLLPFWRMTLAGTGRGRAYPLNHDIAGRLLGPANRRLVAQARTLWFLARLVRAGRGGAGNLELAARGFRFLARRLWDGRYGGFY